MLSVVLLSGCVAKNSAISPPSDDQWVDVEIKAPINTQAAPLAAFYISDKCKKERYNTDMKIYLVPGTKTNYVNMDFDEISGNFKSKIPIDGGGQCEWKLSRITLGIKYSRSEHIIKNSGVKIGTAVGIEVVFDEQGERSGDYISANNPLSVSPTYHPIVKERYIVAEGIFLSLFGKKDFELYKINNYDGRNLTINFSPIIDESKVVKMVGPKIKKKGNHWRIEYPDGSVTSNGEVTPDFEKLSSM
ncbi:hypothetical protein ymoll0001_41250 [Yersinia mollaretii ATCC 43969]|uniref:Lipoprotein n=2 Tax=Yersinia mollaretii TaxID=33060 RepID=A0ABM9Y4E7_YERMW|nr:hypothetical protein [Yersinia mollaretii]EEQ08587.1 hypothetical protein ymoll0001_41250 [Yersinia mollaretii ATCC 43969]